MDKESLKLARRVIIETLNKTKFKNNNDKAELMLNLFILLDENNYDNDLKKLMKRK